MAIWFAIALLAGIIFILGIFYLINSVHRYGKWLAPTILLIASLIVCVGCGLNAYHLHQVPRTCTSLRAVAYLSGGWTMSQRGIPCRLTSRRRSTSTRALRQWGRPLRRIPSGRHSHPTAGACLPSLSQSRLSERTWSK